MCVSAVELTNKFAALDNREDRSDPCPNGLHGSVGQCTACANGGIEERSCRGEQTAGGAAQSWFQWPEGSSEAPQRSPVSKRRHKNKHRCLRALQEDTRPPLQVLEWSTPGLNVVQEPEIYDFNIVID